MRNKREHCNFTLQRLLASIFLGGILLSPSLVYALPPEIHTEVLKVVPIRVHLEDWNAQSSKVPLSNFKIVPVPKNPILKVPKGFHISIFAAGLNEPTWLSLTPEGDVLVTEKENILFLSDSKSSGGADQIYPFAGTETELVNPFGAAFSSDSVFVSTVDSIFKYKYRPGQNDILEPGELIAHLSPNDRGMGWTRNFLISPDGKKLFLSVDMKEDADSSLSSAIVSMNLDGSSPAFLKNGLHNPIAFKFQPLSAQLFVIASEGAAGAPIPDYLTGITDQLNYGPPYTDPALFHPGGTTADKIPDVLFSSQGAVRGMTFYSAANFPARYYNGAFVTLGGLKNQRSTETCKIVFVPFNDAHQPLGYYEDFITGFMSDHSAWGQPTGIIDLPDGSLLFSDPASGRIYRVSYSGNERPKHVVIP